MKREVSAAKRVQNAVRVTKKLFGPRARRAFLGRTRAHVEFRDVRGAELTALARAVEAEFAALDGVRWARLSPPLQRVVVEIEDGRVGLDEIVERVERAELAAGVARASFRDTVWEHPADTETSERLLLSLAAEALGVASGTALRFSLIPASRLAGTLASLLQIVQASPRLRQRLDERFGPLRAGLGLGVGAAIAHGVAQRPGSAFVELAHQALKLSEANARRQSWEHSESLLFRNGPPGDLGPEQPEVTESAAAGPHRGIRGSRGAGLARGVRRELPRDAQRAARRGGAVRRPAEAGRARA